MQITKNQAAFITVASLSLATGGCAATAAIAITSSKTAAIAYGILAITFGGISIASITAWIKSPASDTAGQYFSKVQHHAGIAVAGLYQFAAQVMVQALIQGLADGIKVAIRRAIAGDDLTINNKKSYA